jgi:hypothetical protein
MTGLQSGSTTANGSGESMTAFYSEVRMHVCHMVRLQSLVHERSRLHKMPSRNMNQMFREYLTSRHDY